MDSEMPENETPLRALYRLRQLSTEIERGLERDDLEVACQAAALLGPTLQQWNAAHETMEVSPGEAAQLALETRQTLTRCEASILKIMGGMSSRLQRLRQGRRRMPFTAEGGVAQWRLDDLLG